MTFYEEKGLKTFKIATEAVISQNQPFQ